jgi:hypothetical protein
MNIRQYTPVYAGCPFCGMVYESLGEMDARCDAYDYVIVAWDDDIEDYVQLNMSADEVGTEFRLPLPWPQARTMWARDWHREMRANGPITC